MTTTICEECGNEFKPSKYAAKNKTRYCELCRKIVNRRQQMEWRKRQPKKCLRCGKPRTGYKWCDGCAKIVHRKQNNTYWRKNYIPGEKYKKVKSLKNSVQSKCPKCKVLHEKDVFYTGDILPAHFFCEKCERVSSRIEEITAGFPDQRFSYAKSG